MSSSSGAGCCISRAEVTRTLERLGRGSRDASGFTLVELLIVCLIISVLVAVAVPAFSSETAKAVDAQAKELTRTAATTAELIATDNAGDYEKVTTAELHMYEPSIPIAEGRGEAYLSAVTGGKAEYSVTAKATGGDELTISQSATGEVTRSCVSPITKTGCKGGEKSSW